MKKIKIVFFTKDSRGGMNTFLKQMRQLDTDKFTYSFCYFKKDMYVKYNKRDVLLNKNYPLELHFTLKKAYLFIKNLIKSYSLIHSEKPNILFTCDVYSFIVISLTKITSPKIKSIHLINNNIYQIIKRRSGSIYKKLIIRTFKRLSTFCDAFVFTSQKLEKFTRKNMMGGSINSKVIHHSVNLSEIKIMANQPLNAKQKSNLTKHNIFRIFTIGRLDEQKDVKTILKAFNLILKTKSNCELFIVGNGLKKRELEIFSRKLNISEKTHFMGWKKNVYKYLKRADIFLFSSFFEGFAMVLVEAMACGVPVVATDSPFGPSEILAEGKYGFLVKVEDFHKISEYTLKILSDKSLSNSLRAKGINRSKDFSLKTMLNNYEKLFANLLAIKN